MIHWDLSTKRILTMEFAEGGQVNDGEYMKKHGIDVNKVLPAALPSLCETEARLHKLTIYTHTQG